MKYRHGGNVREMARRLKLPETRITDFSSNINCFTGSAGTYPDTELSPYLGPLADFLGVAENRITLGSGLTYFIHRFPSWYSRNRSILVAPIFGEYRRSSSIYTENYSTMAFEDLLGNADEIFPRFKPESIYMNRPESCTGNLYSEAGMRRILEAAMDAGSKVFIDEAFMEFVSNWKNLTLTRWIDDYENLYVGRSLSKVAGIPDLRIGYVLTNEENTVDLQSRMEPWLIRQSDLEFVRDFPYDILANLPDQVRLSREFLIGGMERMGFIHIGNPTANYVTFRVPHYLDAATLEERLNRMGILIRSLADYPEFGRNCIRLAVRKVQEEQAFLELLAKIISDATDKEVTG
ncbi:MAG: aminotransferase class I/II-fold pyridoxal phosphate-dependent enzyme [Thermoplasmataceae archaeon]